MTLKNTGALLSHPRQGMRWSALLLCVAALAGCRDTQGPDAGVPGEEFIFRLSYGTTFTLTRWQLDPYGYRVVNSNVPRYWTVIADSVSVKGHNGVTVVVDSVAGMQPDTLLLRCLPAGDIYQYGFLAGVTKRLLGRTIPPAWDLLASFSRGMQSTWTVGTSDSLGTRTAIGQTSGTEMLFQIRVNGVSRMFPAYRVEILTDEIGCVFWISDAPSAFTYLREELLVPGGSVGGQVSDLSHIQLP